METHPQPHIQPPSGRIVGPRHLFPVRVHYEDTDLSGIVYHANYLKFCERGRSDLLRMLGIDQRAAVEAGEGTYAVADAQIKWRAPAKLEDALVIESSATQLRAASVSMHQRVLRAKTSTSDSVGENAMDLLAELDIRVGFVSLDGRPRRQPARWRALFDQFAKDELGSDGPDAVRNFL